MEQIVAMEESFEENKNPNQIPVFQEINNETLPVESPDLLSKKRKSLGRRVSFASKAKVRFIDKDSDMETEERDHLDDDVFLVSKPPTSPESPKSLHPIQAVGGQRESLSSNGSSIEIELRDPNSSFSEYSSGDDVIQRAFSLDDMEMTNCVGGIIISKDRAEDSTMDLTSCIGGILEKVQQQQQQQQQQEQPVSPSSIDTMELTSMVGGIVINQQQQQQQQQQQSQPSKSLLDSPMDMTVILKDTIKLNSMIRVELPASPSPFLVSSPKKMLIHDQKGTAGVGVDVDVDDCQSEISFIGDVDKPKTFDFETTPQPKKEQIEIKGAKSNQRPKDEEEEDFTLELFNKYIDTTRLNDISLSNFTNILGAATNSAKDQKSEIQLTPQNQKSIPQETLSPLESPTVTILLPRASLKEFLNDTGVRFLDNLSSLNRRETTGRPRESEHVTFSKQFFVDTGLSLESDALDSACNHLAKMISELKEELGKQEEQFNHSPPLAFLEYRDPGERPLVISKLKTLKSIARLYAKQSWYQWRQTVHSSLNSNLERNLLQIGRTVQKFEEMESRIDEIISYSVPINEKVESELSSLNERLSMMETDDVEQAQHLEQLVTEQQVKLNNLDSEMSDLIRREEELRQAVESAVRKRQELQASVSTLKQQVSSIPRYSPMILEELRSGFNLLQGVTGWKILRVSPSEILLQYSRSDIRVILKTISVNGGKLNVLSTSFDVSSVKSRLLKHAPRLIKVPENLSLSQSLVYTGEHLDRLCHLEKQFSLISVHCTVSIPDTLGVSTDMVPISLGFLSSNPSCKFDILLTVGPEHVSYSQFVSFYGNVKERQVEDAVRMSLNCKGMTIKKLASTVISLIELLN